jgi:protocatechuate 3,4-dioxygenase beta subunit
MRQWLLRAGCGVVLAAVVWLGIAPAALAGHGLPRGTTASLSGQVEDRSGAPLAGAALVLLGPDPAPVRRSLHTDRDGGYRIIELAPGRYRLRVRYLDQVEEERELSLAAGESQRLDVRLPR